MSPLAIILLTAALCSAVLGSAVGAGICLIAVMLVVLTLNDGASIR